MAWVLAAVAMSAVAPAAARVRAGTLRVLFVGNSYSRHHDLTGMVERLAAADQLAPVVETDLVFLPGADLRRHWRTRKATSFLAKGSYTHVVLQGHSLDAIERPDALRDYMGRFADVAREAGLHTVLYATWARHGDSPLYLRGHAGRTPEEMTDRIDRTYRRIAGELHAEVAPVGRAFLRALEAHPQLRLHRPDHSHPTERGSYLAACVLFGSLTGADPVGNPYRPPSIEAAEARSLQRAAAAILASP
jgi:hypothetical protein